MPLPRGSNPVISSALSALQRALRRGLAHPRWVVAMIATLLYANTIENRPVLDDGWVIFDNSLIKSLRNVPAIFRQPYNAATLSGNNAGLYRPVTTLSYAINYAIGGPNRVGFPRLNIPPLLLLCLLLLRLGRLLPSAAPLPQPPSPALLRAPLF